MAGEDWRVVILVNHLDGDGSGGHMRGVRCLHLQIVLCPCLMVKWPGQGNLPTEAINAKHVVWITSAGKIVGDGRVGVHIISSDGGDDCSHL